MSLYQLSVAFPTELFINKFLSGALPQTVQSILLPVKPLEIDCQKDGTRDANNDGVDKDAADEIVENIPRESQEIATLHNKCRVVAD